MDSIEKWGNIYKLIRWLREALKEDLPASREKSLALTKLNECEMWAEKCELVDDNVS